MRYILNLVYLCLFICYFPVLVLQKKIQGKQRPGIWNKFFGIVPGYTKHNAQSSGCVVFHAVSLGEVNAIRQLVLNYQKAHPQKKIVVSTTTQTGFQAAQKSFPGIPICLLPFDFSWAIDRFLNTLSPEKLVLAELEIWPNLLAACRRRNIDTCLVNGRLSEKSFKKYRRWNFFFRSVFANLNLVCVQHADYRERFAMLGVPDERIRVLGNLKYDSLSDIDSDPRIGEFRQWLDIQPSDIFFLAGSTQAPEESLAIDAYLNLQQEYPQLRLIICPRHPERFDAVADLLETKQVAFVRRSEFEHPNRSTFQSVDSRVEEVVPDDESRNLLIDSVGELRAWWALADVAFVGGSFGNRGGQNMMEPAALGAAVCFGPNTRNFVQEVTWLTRDDAAIQLHEGSDLTDFLGRCLADPDFRNRLGLNAKRTVQSLLGGEQTVWEKTINALEQVNLSTSGTSPLAKAA